MNKPVNIPNAQWRNRLPFVAEFPRDAGNSFIPDPTINPHAPLRNTPIPVPKKK